MSSSVAALSAMDRRRRRNQLVRSITDPAAKAYLIGYLLDLVPSLLKAVLRFVTREIKRIRALQKRRREEVQAAKELGPDRVNLAKVSTLHDIVLPTLQGVPRLGSDAVKAAFDALSPQAMASSCALAMVGWGVTDEALSSVLIRSTIADNAGSVRRARKIAQIRIWTCFIAASLSSATSLMLLQTSSANTDGDKSSRPSSSLRPSMSPSTSLNSFKRTFVNRMTPASGNTSALPTPLAPGGHFLARLTSLSIPVTPAAPGSRSPTQAVKPLPEVEQQGADAVFKGKTIDREDSTLQLPASKSAIESLARAKGSSKPKLGKPSPTVDLTLFALVRGLDTLVRAAPLFLGKGLTKAGQTPSKPAIGNARSRESLGAGLGSRRWQVPNVGSSLLSRISAGLSNQAEGLTFVFCCAIIMWSWFYAPERLPPTYVRWITNLATMDERLLLALRSIRTKVPHFWNYGDSATPPASIDMLGSLAESLGHPYHWGDPTRLPGSAADAQKMLAQARAEAAQQSGQKDVTTKSIPPTYILSGAAGSRGRGEMGGIPCELVHCGVGGSSCLANAGLRWARGWKVCMGIYVPVHLLPRLLFNPKQFAKEPISAITKVLIGSARSASFLATYIASIWFMVCLERTMLFPRLFPSVSHKFWDRGLGPLMGCIACGFAIFIEERRKRSEMALYVAPRALYALAEMGRPGWLSSGERGAIWAERVVFGLAVGIVVTASRFRPDFLRGVTSVMAWVVKSEARNQRLARLAGAVK